MTAPAATTTVLVTVTGPDRPGVTWALLDAVRSLDLTVLDMEQVVIRGTLVLGLLLGGAQALAAEHLVVAAGARLGLMVNVSPGADEVDRRRSGRLHVTVLGRPLRPAAVAAVAAAIAGSGANIDRIVRLSAYPVTTIEMQVSGGDQDDRQGAAQRLRGQLAVAAAEEGVDVAVQPSGLYLRAKRLVVLDVDSTLIRDEVIELVADIAGCGPQVRRITAAAMRGELDFETALRDRVALLAGVPESVLDQVRSQVTLTPGARTLVRTLARLGYRTALVSGGFAQVIMPLAAELGIDFVAANTVGVDAGRLTGQIIGPVVDRAGKAAALVRFAGEAGVPVSQTVAVGDGANDVDMLATAGLGIAFNAKPAVAAAADTALTVPYLDAILYLLGISREDIEEADGQAAPRMPPPLLQP